MSATESCDVLVIGGGPAGSTAGNLLAQAGRRSSFTVVRLQRHLPLRPPLERSAVFAAG